MTELTFGFGGLDLRSNQLNVTGDTARDCSNVFLDYNNKLRKRKDFIEYPISKSTSVTYTDWINELPPNSVILDIMDFDGDIIMVVDVPDVDGVEPNVNALYRADYNDSTITRIPCNCRDSGGVQAKYGWSNSGSQIIDGHVTYFHKNENLYFMGDDEGIQYKYDGKVWQPAGTDNFSPFYINATDAGTLAGNNWYVRNIRFSVDNNGNQVFGAWTVDQISSGGSNLTYGKQYYIDEYKSPYFISNAPQVINTVNPTVTASSTFVMVGQIVYASEIGTNNIYRWEVESFVTNTSVTLKDPRTLTLNSDGTIEWEVAAPFSIAIPLFGGMDGGLTLSYFSRDYSVGYQFGGVGVTLNSTLGFDYDPLIPPVMSSNPLLEPYLFSTYFEDFYGSEIKGNAPKGFQIREYGDACVLVDTNNMYFSDLSINGTVENFTAFDNFKVGEEEKGDIKGFFTNENFIAVFRKNDSYLIAGNIFTGNFSTQSYRETRIGSIAPHSIVEVEGQCLVMTNRGPQIAMENASMSGIGDAVEPVFADNSLGLNLRLEYTKSIIDVRKECVLMFLRSSISDNSRVIVYDYRNKKWFFWDDMDARAGVLRDPQGDNITYCDGFSMFYESDVFVTGVDAYWISNFESFKKPALRKRVKRLSIHQTDKSEDPLDFKAYINWNNTPYTDVTMTGNGLDSIDSRRVNPKTGYSHSFYIGSTGLNEFRIDGFGVDVNIEQDGVVDDSR